MNLTTASISKPNLEKQIARNLVRARDCAVRLVLGLSLIHDGARRSDSYLGGTQQKPSSEDSGPGGEPCFSLWFACWTKILLCLRTNRRSLGESGLVLTDGLAVAMRRSLFFLAQCEKESLLST